MSRRQQERQQRYLNIRNVVEEEAARLMSGAHLVVEHDVTANMHRFPETIRIPREPRSRGRRLLAVYRLSVSRQQHPWRIIYRSVKLGGSMRQSLNRIGSLQRSSQHRSLMTDSLDVYEDEDLGDSADEPVPSIPVSVQEWARRIVSNRSVVNRLWLCVLCLCCVHAMATLHLLIDNVCRFPTEFTTLVVGAMGGWVECWCRSVCMRGCACAADFMIMSFCWGWLSGVPCAL
jgi:hypothetical protein